MSTTRVTTALLATGCLALAGCAGERPQSTTSQRLDSGVTASSGGSMPNGTAGVTTTTTPPVRR